MVTVVLILLILVCLLCVYWYKRRNKAAYIPIIENMLNMDHNEGRKKSDVIENNKLIEKEGISLTEYS